MGASWLRLNISSNTTSNYVCSLCGRTFSSSQALGGHQNAHRNERNDLRMHYIRQRLQNLKNIALNNAAATTTTATTTWPQAPTEDQNPGLRYGVRPNRTRTGGSLLEEPYGLDKKSGSTSNYYDDHHPYHGNVGGYNLSKLMPSLELTLAVETEQGNGVDHDVMTSGVEELDLTLRL